MKDTPQHPLDVERYHPDELRPYHRNPRLGDVEAIARSLEVNGQYRPVVVNLGSKTGRPLEVLAGNHTLAAAKHLGWGEIVGTVVDVDDKAAARIVAADNRTADLGGYDDDVLVELLTELDDAGGLDGSGYSAEALDDLLALAQGPISLDDLAAEFGDFTDADTLRNITLKVPAPLFHQWSDWRRGYDSDADALEAALDR